MIKTSYSPENTATSSGPAISIIIPVYNSEQTLPDCLASFIKQHFLNIEIILVNDCSTDGTALLCQSYALAYTYISYLALPTNQGQGAARNAGLDAAKGEYILFVDADDTIHQDMLCKLYEKAQNSNADIVVCGYSRIENGKIGTVLPQKEYTAHTLLLDEKIFPVPWNKLFNRKFLCKHSITFPSSRCAEDVAFVCKASFCAEYIYVYREDLYNYMIYTNSVSHGMEHRSGVFISLLDIKYFLQRIGKYEEYKTILWKLIFNHTIRYPMHLLLISSLWHGKNRKKNIYAFPLYVKNFIIFIFTYFRT